MTVGTSIFLFALGAILYFAVNATLAGIEIKTIGVILMVVGVIGLVISLLYARMLAPRGEREVVRDRERR
ncbi:MAG TPA: DUF6458 family protein [Thermoleophilaceae bacterium]|nr:DUF6458 family protein [Thermoleophilaceae bacterium]